MVRISAAVLIVLLVAAALAACVSRASGAVRPLRLTEGGCPALSFTMAAGQTLAVRIENHSSQVQQVTFRASSDPLLARRTTIQPGFAVLADWSALDAGEYLLTCLPLPHLP